MVFEDEEDTIKTCEGTAGKPVVRIGGGQASDGNGFALWATPNKGTDTDITTAQSNAQDPFTKVPYDIFLSWWMTDSPSGLGASDIHGVGGAINGERVTLNKLDEYATESGTHLFVSPGQSAGCLFLGTFLGDFEYSLVGGYMAWSGSATCGLNVEIGWPTNVEMYCEATINHDWATRFSRFGESVDMITID